MSRDDDVDRAGRDDREPDPESDLDRLARAARAAADSTEGIDPTIVEDAIRYAREEAGTGRTRYRTLLADVAGLETVGAGSGDGSVDEGSAPDREPGPDPRFDSIDSQRRAFAYVRLRRHVERRRSRESDVDGLFE